ncbi:uncharacterized protein CEXT_294081 [Caerostris extrusa]|uniref:Uncharacterized protein n=1 Tax=Caerostris extrusa TaxID=172846 RepID=A0AAV4QMB6_CAEEX|nr:uncharacterized protein CEXT_294081 [Caerostris extrusa]
MISQLEDAFQQSVDPIAEAIYFSTLVLASQKHKGIRQDKIDMCSEYALRTPPMPSHPKYRDRVFCLCAKNGHVELRAQSAGRLRSVVQPRVELAADGADGQLLGAHGIPLHDIGRHRKIQRNFVIYTAAELVQIKRNVSRDMTTLEKAVNNYVPVLNPASREVGKKTSGQSWTDAKF